MTQITSKPQTQLKDIKVSHLNIELRAATQRLPIHWLNFKNYYSKFGKYPSNVQWQKPILNIEGMTFEDIVSYYDKQDSDVYSFSSYLWSHLAVKAVAEELKKRNPNRIVVFGGPHLGITHNRLGWFSKHKYIDAVCEPTSYGEWFMTDMLDQLVENDLNWSNVAFSIHRKGVGKTRNKREFQFPGALIPGNEDIVFECKDISLERNIPLVLPMEFSRGCPYECVFCEWGGGIGGKVIRKDYQMIMEDLNLIPHYGIEQIQILDANYGIFKEDEEVSKHIEYLKGTFGLPNHVEIYGFTKSKQERRWATVEPLARAGVIQRYKLSLQTLSDEALRNIKRTDIPRDEDFAFAKHLTDSYNVRADFEFIMGLPGTTRDDFYDEIDIQHEYGYNLERYTWMFLPDSPAYGYDYRNKFGLETVKTCVGKTKMNSYLFDDIKNFSEYNITADPKYISDVEIVVKSDSYTREDYTEFFFMNFWIIQGYSSGAGKDINPDAERPESNELSIDIKQGLDHYLKSGQIKSPSLFYRKLYERVMDPGENEYAKAMRVLRDEIHEFICGNRKEIVDFREFTLPYTDTSVELSYIFRSCVYVFNEDYLKLMQEICLELGVEIPKEFIDRFKTTLKDIKLSHSPKYDRSYQILTFYEKFINERYKKSN